MGRKSDRDAIRPEGGKTEPPCMAAGDDPVLSRTPAWAQPTYPSGGVGTWVAAGDGAFSTLYPSLFEFLTLTGWGGKQRRSGTILIFAEDSKWKACLNDRDGGRYAFVSSDSVQGLLESCNGDLEQGQVDWRVSKNKR